MKTGFLFPVIFTLLISIKTFAADWTFMVFLNGDNDLEDFVQYSLDKINAYPSTKQVNVLVQVDTLKGPAQRYKVTQDPTASKLEELGEVDMGDWHELVNFFEWGVKNYPAQKYAMIIWDHGMGWKNSEYEDTTNNFIETIPGIHIDYEPKSISYDDTNKNFISVTQLRKALIMMALKNNFKRLDLLATDACLMSTMEVAYEMEGLVDILVASEELLPAQGFAYDTIFKDLENNSSMDQEELGKVIVDRTIEMMDDLMKTAESPAQIVDYETHLAALNINNIEAIRSALDDFASALMKHPNFSLIDFYYILRSVKSASGDYDYFDLKGLILSIMDDKQFPKEEAMAESANRLLQILDQSILTSKITVDGHYEGFSGLTVYFTDNQKSFDENIKLYQTFQFAKNSLWDEFLQTLIQIK